MEKHENLLNASFMICLLSLSGAAGTLNLIVEGESLVSHMFTLFLLVTSIMLFIISLSILILTPKEKEPSVIYYTQEERISDNKNINRIERLLCRLKESKKNVLSHIKFIKFKEDELVEQINECKTKISKLKDSGISSNYILEEIISDSNLMLRDIKKEKKYLNKLLKKYDEKIRKVQHLQTIEKMKKENEDYRKEVEETSSKIESIENDLESYNYQIDVLDEENNLSNYSTSYGLLKKFEKIKNK